MPGELPIACTLNAADLSQRMTTMARLGADALVDVHLDGSRAELRFAAGAGIRGRVEALVAAESACCSFLTMRVTGEPGAVVLTIDAPEGAQPVLAELVDAFRATPATG